MNGDRGSTCADLILKRSDKSRAIDVIVLAELRQQSIHSLQEVQHAFFVKNCKRQSSIIRFGIT